MDHPAGAPIRAAADLGRCARAATAAARAGAPVACSPLEEAKEGAHRPAGVAEPRDPRPLGQVGD